MIRDQILKKIIEKKESTSLGKLILRSLQLNCSLQIYEETIFLTAQKNKWEPFLS